MKEELHYWRIDFLGDNGFSVCVCTTTDYNEEEIVDAAVKANVVDADDVKHYYTQVEEITNDEYEMKHWKDNAHIISDDDKASLSSQFEKVYQSIIDCDDTIKAFVNKNFATDTEAFKKLADMAAQLHSYAHELEERLAWD